MASLIPGYEYDIFICYRQKDNKGDRWVSSFLETLKTELECKSGQIDHLAAVLIGNKIER